MITIIIHAASNPIACLGTQTTMEASDFVHTAKDNLDVI